MKIYVLRKSDLDYFSKQRYVVTMVRFIPFKRSSRDSHTSDLCIRNCGPTFTDTATKKYKTYECTIELQL